MDKKAARLQLLKQVHQRHLDREDLQFAGLQANETDVQDEMTTMDSFREDRRASNNTLTSDE